MTEQHFVILIEPKPQSRPRFARRGKFVQTYEATDMADWKKEFTRLLLVQSPILIENRSIESLMTFYIMPPKTISGIKRNAVRLQNEQIRVSKKPDADNYEKACWDCMSGIVFKDDGQISDWSGKKRYSLNPRIEITIKSMEEN